MISTKELQLIAFFILKKNYIKKTKCLVPPTVSLHLLEVSWSSRCLFYC